jgi:hypothetical protein
MEADASLPDGQLGVRDSHGNLSASGIGTGASVTRLSAARHPDTQETAMRLFRIRTVVAAGVLSAATLALAAPAAFAEGKIPENTIKSECKAAGGTYSHGTIAGGARLSTCKYKDYRGNEYIDTFINGRFKGTIAF